MTTTSLLPAAVPTERLLLRRWHPAHAPALKLALDASVHHLASWIPWRIAEPASVPDLEARLARHVDDFDAGREWVYAIFPAAGPDGSAVAADGADVLGAVGLYPRDATGRVSIDAADRLELGYWLHVNATGRGYATEATRAAVALAETLPGIAHLEIRCDPRNAASAAVPRRLGFAHVSTDSRPAAEPGRPPSETMIWVRAVTR